MTVTFTQLAASPTAVSPTEAVALALAAAAGVSSAELSVFPDPGDILLSREGVVSIRDGYTPAMETAPAQWLAARIADLLALDAGVARQGRAAIPGGLLMLLARTAGQIDLPPLSYAALVDGLQRFGSPDPAVLRAIHDSHALAGIEPPAAGYAAIPVVQSTPRTRVARSAVAALVGVAAGVVLGFVLFSGRVDIAGPPGIASASKAPASKAPAMKPQEGGASAPPATAVVRSDQAVVRSDQADDPQRSVPVLNRDNVFSPSFAAGGRELLFHAGRERGSLMRGSLDASGVVRAVTPLGRESGSYYADYHVTPSPDGRWLAFDSDRDGVRGVYVARPDGRGARRVSGEGYAAIPTWSPDGRRIAFVRAEPDQSRVWNIWLAGVEDATLERFTQHRRGQPWGASWFPDGQRVAYSLEDGLVIAGLRDGTSVTIPSPRPGRLVRTPAVSPDGTHVIFQVFGDGVWLLDVRTLNLRRVLDEPTAEEFAWAPDGRRVAFHAQRNGAWSLWQTAVDPARDSASPPTPLLPG